MNLILQPRIFSIDALRAIALLGIFLVHAHDGYNLYAAAPALSQWDALYDWGYKEFFLSKSYMLFAFLFGLSFYLQLSRAQNRGIDFRARFCWRLLLLIGFGLLHSLFYFGDILIIFGVLGLPLVLLWNLSNRILWSIIAILLLQPVALWNDLLGNPEALLYWYSSVCSSLNLPSMPSPDTSTWWQLAEWNITTGTTHAFLYMIWSSRLGFVILMFVLGIIAGRMRFMDSNPRRMLKLALLGAGLYTICLFLDVTALRGYIPTVLHMWENLAFVLFFGAFMAWLLSRSALQAYLSPLVALGKCTLTCYVMQSVIMTYLLAGWGCGLGGKLSLSSTLLLCLVIYLLQIGFSMLWLRFFKYGPLEGIWRRLTQVKFPTFS